jgi:hypothetical protein
VERTEIRIAGSPSRCPFCHSDIAVASEDWVACRGCLARHHAPCWKELTRCGACGHDRALADHVPGAPEDNRHLRRTVAAGTKGIEPESAGTVPHSRLLLSATFFMFAAGIMLTAIMANGLPPRTGEEAALLVIVGLISVVFSSAAIFVGLSARR